MQCPKCETGNPDTARFCVQCAQPLEIECPRCHTANPARARFCMACAHPLTADSKHDVGSAAPADDSDSRSVLEGERKHVTILFTDLSGYTAMSEHLDPEEVKEIVNAIFDRIAGVIAKYDGLIEKFVGDAVMAVFGVPKVHEDDAARAMRAALEIHEIVDKIDPELTVKTGRPLSMHTGINTGLVVTGQADVDKGIHGVSGDTVNVAARLSSLAGPGDILVGRSTFRDCEAFFRFERLPPIRVKGKQAPVAVFKFLGDKDDLIFSRRLSGVTAELVGRDVQLNLMKAAFHNLRDGKTTILSIVGDAGTGKSRLVEEFRNTLDIDITQWIQGYAYSYTKNTPYFQLIDLLNRTLTIDDRDPPDQVRRKLESAIRLLLRKSEDILPYIGRLYALDSPEWERYNPELWKTRLQQAVLSILSAMAGRKPTIVCLEDLHWSDPSTLDLLRFLLMRISVPVLFLCTFRPPFTFLENHQIRGLKHACQQIELKDLPAAEARLMVCSMLKTDQIPRELEQFIQTKLEGNPFYMEETINALIESDTLVLQNGRWTLTRAIDEWEVSSTVYGVIFERLDRLEQHTKRTLQEASVIGRTFLYRILERVTAIKADIDKCLSGLERIDLIRARSFHQEIEYFFKHAMTQEVVYNGILKKDRRDIHERVGRVIEQLFHDRLSEYYELLAYHFKQGHSVGKAIEYLIKSGEKCLEKYAVEEADQFYQQAFELLSAKKEKSKDEALLLIDLLNNWGYVYYYLGNFKAFSARFGAYLELAEKTGDERRLGMFYIWYGIAELMSGRASDSYDLLMKAKALGEKCRDPIVEGYANTWLAWNCAELGRYAEGIAHGQKAQRIAEDFPSDPYLFFKSLAGLGFVYAFMGLPLKSLACGKGLLAHGKQFSNSRSMVMGHFAKSMGYVMAGDYAACIENCHQAVRVSKDPFYAKFPAIAMNLALVLDGQYEKALESQRELLPHLEGNGVGMLVPYLNLARGAALAGVGQMSKGFRLIEQSRRDMLKNKRKTAYAMSEFVLGMVYAQMAIGPSPSLSVLARNALFILKNAPFAVRKAKAHLEKSIELTEAIGADGYRGLSYFQLGLLYRAQKNFREARRCIAKSVEILSACQAETNLIHARKELTALG